MKSLALPARFGSAFREARTRLPRGPLIVMVLGASLMLGHGFVQDYAQALASPDGLYIPDARHVVPEGTPPGNYSHTFRIYNNARPWTTSFAASADCDCTGLSWEKATVPPFVWKSVTAKMKVPLTCSRKVIPFRVRVFLLKFQKRKPDEATTAR